MKLDSLVADPETDGDSLVGQAIGECAQDLQLARRQGLDGLIGVARPFEAATRYPSTCRILRASAIVATSRHDLDVVRQRPAQAVLRDDGPTRITRT